MAIVTRTEVKDYMDIQDTDDDTLIDNLITRAETFAENYTNKIIEQQSNKIEKFNWSGQSAFVLPDFPVVVNKFQTNDWDLDNPVWDDVKTNSYAVDEEKGIIYLYFRLPKGIKNIKVDYDAWYATVPLDIKQAIIMIIAHWLNNRQSMWINSEQIEWWSISYNHNKLPTEAKAILDKYKNIQMLSIG